MWSTNVLKFDSWNRTSHSLFYGLKFDQHHTILRHMPRVCPPCCGRTRLIQVASKFRRDGPYAACEGSVRTSDSWWPMWQKHCLVIQLPAPTPRRPGPSCLTTAGMSHWTPSSKKNHRHRIYVDVWRERFSPMTQKGFLANLSLPLHPLYRQQHPAAHIRTMYSTPNTTMVTISCWSRNKRVAFTVWAEGYTQINLCIKFWKGYPPGCTRHSLSYFWTL